MDADIELIPEGKGIFDVRVNGDLVYSKFETGSFPDERELVAQIASQHQTG